MKLRYILPTMAVAVAALTGCSEDYEVDNLGTVQLSTSYVTIPQNGGNTKITIRANGDWSLDHDVTFETDSLNAEKGKVNYDFTTGQLALKNDDEDNTWFTVSPAHGGAGTSEITFSADPTTKDRESTIQVKVGDTYQNIVVSQKLAATAPDTVSVKDVLNGSDATTYCVRGFCKSIASTYYGNFYMVDTEGNELYIYGTVDESGSYNWSSFNIEPGDEVIVQGPRTTYGSTIELNDASFIKVTKALITADASAKTIEQGTDPFTITLTQKGTAMSFSTDCDWLSFEGDGYTTNAAGGYVFTIRPKANTTGKTRTGYVTFKSSKIEKSDTTNTVLNIPVTQLAAPVEASSVYDLAQKVKAGSRSNQVEFYVTLSNAKVTYKNGDNYFIEDGNGGLCIYNGSLGLKVGDIVNGKVWGKGYAYNQLPEATEFNTDLATVTHDDDIISPTVVSLAELAANFDHYVSRYIRVENVTLASAIDATYTNVASHGSITDGTNTLALRIQRTGSYKPKNLADGVKGVNMYFYYQAEAGSTINVTCVPTVYNKNQQLSVYSVDWLK